MEAPHKQCFKCGAVKPLSEFYAHKMMADGHLNKCKACTKNDVKEHREINVERIRQYDKKRAADPDRRRKSRARLDEWKFQHPDRRRAQVQLGNAVRAGLVKRLPCEVCGSHKSEAHHPHYGAPLLVTWLCRPHHMQIHKQAEATNAHLP
jgi:hypothetical protein